jgi:hypothetical protein
MRVVRPEKSIVPIVRAGEGVPIKELLGTGFFVGSPSELHVVTARHVFDDNPLQDGELYGVAFPEEDRIRFVQIPGYHSSNQFDVAVFSGEHFPEAVPLQFASTEYRMSLNIDVLTFEYSLTRIERDAPNHTLISFEPIAHKGNIMRLFDSDFPERVPTPSFLTSFPALRGASGAPVMVADKMTVVGMLVANQERHLMPAQVVRCEDANTNREEVSYFLPTGKAIQGSVILEVLEKFNIPVQVARSKRGFASSIWEKLMTVIR